jgi:uncharacterized membrane protein
VHRNTLRLDAILALSAAGMAIAGYLTWVALDAPESVACGPLGDCHAVQTSEYARVAGVPVAALGLAMYGALLTLGIVCRLQPSSLAAPVGAFGSMMFAIAFAGVLYSAYLTYLELAVIEAICAWCVASALIITGIWLLSLPDARSPAR